ncbi:transmembrane protein 87A-like [Portunus trituberculatus]|uniref:transmembrane protein 87A-like n=1 Tax=Portunus trituberculatus TaxID=210409 RepID=UPI001E1CC938|nr:transmembrane protein 87A-like [Portunus trituberculatus]XP_045104458.1 transmembrane protein 87A-like [Portunus trituberculatus]
MKTCPILLTLCWAATTYALLEQGVWHLTAGPGHEYVGVTKSLFKGSRINIKVKCDPEDPNRPLNISIAWLLRKTPCWNEYSFPKGKEEELFMWYFRKPGKLPSTPNGTRYETAYYMKEPATYLCDHNIVLDDVSLDSMTDKGDAVTEKSQMKAERETQDGAKAGAVPGAAASQYLSSSDISINGQARTNHPVTIVPTDGVYLLDIHIAPADYSVFNASYVAYVDIEMKSDYGYLSAANWPLLGFYGAMCVVYLVYGFVWLIVSAMRWRELLRVQYWIGAVIFLGMLEMSMFTAEYSSLNGRGYSVSGLLIVAELVSCAKRTLARMLIIIVSLGFGIVKPRLGVVLHRVVGVGLIYFVLASIEGCTRALQPRNNSQHQLASVPLSLLESAICFWIFTAMVQTTRTLRLRHNLVKLSLYTHFTNTLTFAVIASVIFMIWSIRYHEFESCLTDWKEFWVDDAYWHILFAILLLVIMILWRPSNNNQRFAISILLEDGSDADDEEESEKLMADISDTMKQRNTHSSSPKESGSVEDDLKWVDENIPSSFVDPVLPILDSEEEIVTTKFEVSKMQ